MYWYMTVIKWELAPLLITRLLHSYFKFYRVEIIAFTAVNNDVTASQQSVKCSTNCFIIFRLIILPTAVIILYYIILYYIILYYIISYHIISYHIISHHITSHHITSHHLTSRHVTSHHITSYIISYHISHDISYISYIVSCHVISYHVISCHIVSSYIIYRIVSYITLYIVSYPIIYIISYHKVKLWGVQVTIVAIRSQQCVLCLLLSFISLSAVYKPECWTKMIFTANLFLWQ